LGYVRLEVMNSLKETDRALDGKGRRNKEKTTEKKS